MELNDKISSIPCTWEGLCELNEMLDSESASVGISSTGWTMVHVKGYEGSVQLDPLALTIPLMLTQANLSSLYLQYLTKSIDTDCYLLKKEISIIDDFNLKEIAANYELCNKVMLLYKKSDEEFSKCWITSRDSLQNLFYDASKKMIKTCQQKMLEFCPTEFREIWPELTIEPKSKKGQGIEERWMVDQPMLIEARDRWAIKRNALEAELEKELSHSIPKVTQNLVLGRAKASGFRFLNGELYS